MLTKDQYQQAVQKLRFVTQMLNEGEELTDIEIMAAFRRGIKEITSYKSENYQLGFNYKA